MVAISLCMLFPVPCLICESCQVRRGYVGRAVRVSTVVVWGQHSLIKSTSTLVWMLTN